MSRLKRESASNRLGSTAEVGSITGGMSGNPTRFDPIVTQIPWLKSKGYLRARDDQYGGDRTMGSRKRSRRRPEQPIPRCLGCMRQVVIVTEEDLAVPLCATCVQRDDDFFVRMAAKLAAFQSAEDELRDERLQALADMQFGKLE